MSEFLVAKPGARRSRRRTVLEWGCLLGLVLSVVLSVAVFRYQDACRAVCRDTLRLHILANSDTIEDQLLKLKVRDAVLGEMETILQGSTDKIQAVEAVRQALPVFQQIAERTLRREHSGQTVAVRLETADFPARDYGSFRLPAGEYTALRIELGAAAGHNWFCVLYPELCVGTSEGRYPGAAENALVFGGYEVRFALWDSARAAWQKMSGR